MIIAVKVFPTVKKTNNTFWSEFHPYTMENSLLMELLSALKPVERDDLVSFSALKIANNGKMKAPIGALLSIFLNHLAGKSALKLEKIVVYEAVFPQQPFVDGKLEKVMVEAHKVVSAFLLMQHYLREENEFNQVFDFAEISHIRGLESRYQHALSRLKNIQDKSTNRNSVFYYQEFKLEYINHIDNCLHNQVKGDLNIPKTIETLEIHYFINRLELLNRYLNQKKMVNVEGVSKPELVIDDLIVPVKYLEIAPLLKVNYTIYSLLRKEHIEPSDTRELFDLLLSNEKNFNAEILQDLYTYLRNVLILALHMNPERYELNITLYDLFKDNLKRGYLHLEGKLHPSRYWAVATSAMRVNDFDWALHFIESHKNELMGENETRDIYRLNLSNYLFHTGRFRECLDHLPATSLFMDYQLACKRLEIKALYELEDDLFQYKLDAFKMFLSRTSPKMLSKNLQKMHLEFVNILAQIASSIPGDKERSERLVDRMEDKKQAIEWQWLMAKARAIAIRK